MKRVFRVGQFIAKRTPATGARWLLHVHGIFICSADEKQVGQLLRLLEKVAAKQTEKEQR